MTDLRDQIESAIEEALQGLVDQCVERDKQGGDPTVVLRTTADGQPSAVIMSYAAYQRSLDRYANLKAENESLAAQVDGNRRQGRNPWKP